MRVATRMLLPALAVVLVVSGTTVPASAAPDTWTKWTAGDTWIRSLDYVTPTQLVAGGENDGVFTSTNPVGPWQNITGNLSTTARQVRQAVGQSGQIYLATSAGLFKGSGNGSWSQLGVAQSTPPAERLNQGGVQSVVFPTGQATTMVVATSGSGRDGVFWSSDSGKSWTRATGLTSGTYFLTGNASAMYAAASTGFYKSTDKGHSWVLRSDGIPPGETPKRITVSPLNSQQLFAATVGGVYRSDTGGASWYAANGSGDGLLNVSEVRAFQLVPSDFWADGVPRMVVGTNSGVWATLDGGLSWSRMSGTKTVADGLSMSNESVYALNIGFGTPGSLIAGTQGHGVFAIPLQSVETPGSIAAPSGTASMNSVLTASDGSWSGTAPFAFLYRWYRCSQSSAADSAGNSCQVIAGETDRTYQPVAADVGNYLRVGVRATNLLSPAPSAQRLSASVGPVTAPPGPVPTPPSTWPRLLDSASAPWGGTMTIQPSNPASPSNGNWNANGVPMATTYIYRWYRCETNGTGCVQQDQSGLQYTTTPADVDHLVQATVIGKIGSTSSAERLAGQSGPIYEQTPQATDPPRVVGPAHIGTVLQSTAGAWTGNGPTFTRRWLRCNASGVQCNPTNPVVTTPTYRVKPGDRGYTFRVEVKAVVVDSFQQRTGTAQSARSAKVNYSPGCLKAKATLTRAQRGVTAATRALRAARQSGNQTRIKNAQRKLTVAKTKLRKARVAAGRAC